MTARQGPLRIGTRGSDLALWQSRRVAELLALVPGAPVSELVPIRTDGDAISELPLSQVAGTAFFTKEIEEALAAGEIDLAVHSLKDLATAMPDGLTLGAVLERQDPRDALVAPPGVELHLDDLPAGARIGTCSLRRQALLRRWRPDLVPLDLRGNVPTRLHRLDQGRFEAIVVAAAGLERLGLGHRVTQFLPVERFLPAVGQGAIAVQARVEDEQTLRWVRALDDARTRSATTAERALLRRLEGGCQIPVGALAEVQSERLTLAAIVCALDGTAAVQGKIEGAVGDAEALGEALAADLLRRGAGEILAAIRRPADGPR